MAGAKGKDGSIRAQKGQKGEQREDGKNTFSSGAFCFSTETSQGREGQQTQGLGNYQIGEIQPCGAIEGKTGPELTREGRYLLSELSGAAPPEQFQAALLLALPSPSVHTLNDGSNTLKRKRDSVTAPPPLMIIKSFCR